MNASGTFFIIEDDSVTDSENFIKSPKIILEPNMHRKNLDISMTSEIIS